MTPKKKKIFKIVAILMIAGLLIGVVSILYMFNMPQRNVQNSDTDFSLTTSQLVTEYLSNAKAANNKYLAEDGDSKILEITGTVASISENFNGQKVVLLKEGDDKAGVSCTFLTETGTNETNLKIGKTTTIKGVIRAGASFDEDLELYEHIILDKCKVVKSNY